MLQVTRACPQCKERGADELAEYSKGFWRVVKCGQCDFVYLANPPEYEELSSDFAWEKTRTAEAQRRKADYPLRSAIDRATRARTSLFRSDFQSKLLKFFRPGRVLDVGCGSGRKVSAPFVPFGVEISEALAADADASMRKHGGYAVHAPAIDGVRGFPDRHFSGIVLRSFLEHETQPRELLAECERVLADDGRIYVRVPNFGSLNRKLAGASWCGFRYPDHVNYFTVQSLKRMAMSTGLRMQRVGLVTPFDDNIKALLFR